MYPGNHTESEILSVPRNLKTRPDAPTTHLAYITDDEDELLKKHKPGTPHKGPHDIPNYDSWDWEGGSVAEGGGFSSDSGSSEQLDYGGGPDLGGAGSTTDWSGSLSDADVQTAPNEIYPWLQGGQSDEWINVSQVGGGVNTPGSLLYGVDLSAYGINPKSEFLPKNFLDMLFEGSVVGGGEYAQSNEPNIGTWEMVEAGTHPLFPGGQVDYYDPYGNLHNAPPAIVGGGSSSGGGWSYGGGSGGGGGGGGSLMQFPGAEGGNPHIDRWGQSDIQRRYIDRMRGMNRGGIVSLC